METIDNQLSISTNVYKPFRDFLREHIRSFGWIFPPKPTQNQLCNLVNRLKRLKGMNDPIAVIGVSEIKGWFQSIWSCSVGNSIAPINIFNDDKICDIILSYCFKLPNKNYITITDYQDLFRQMRRWLEINKYVVSIFKPLLAKWILQKYARPDSVVWDPCAGFGGRLLGFLATCPKGRYIACEPNGATWKELTNLISIVKDKNVEIHQTALENFTFQESFADLVFTCPPYRDKEIYCRDSNQAYIRYATVQAWESDFMGKLMSQAYKSLKRGGRAIIVFDQKNSISCIRAAIRVGFIVQPSDNIIKIGTFIKPKPSIETILCFLKP